MGNEVVTCAVGLPIPAASPCPYCGATRDGLCKMQDEFSLREVRENKRRPVTVREQLEVLAKDCEERASEAAGIQGNALRSRAAERSWLSVAHRIRFIAGQMKD